MARYAGEALAGSAMNARTWSTVSENAASFLRKNLGFLAFDLVDDVEEIRDGVLGHAVAVGEPDPGMAVRGADDEIPGDETEGEHRLDGQGDQLRIGCRTGFAENVHVELVELASPALLRFFVTETLADFEPLERFRKIPLVLGDEPGQRGGDLGPQRHIAPALVLEAEKLGGNLATGFFQIESGVLENGRLVFHIPAAAGDGTPGFEQIIANRAFTGNEVAESWECLE